MAFSILAVVASSARAEQAVPGERVPAPSVPATPVSGESVEDKERAQLLVREAFRMIYDGEHALALGKFEEAYAIFPSPKILLNMGTSLKKLGRYAEAADTYELYLAHPEADAARIAEVKRELAEADAHVATLRIEVNVPDANVLIDGKALEGDYPMTLRVDAGSHTIIAERDGYQAHTETLHGVKGRETRGVTITLVSLADVEADKRREKAEAFDLGQSAALSVIKRQQVSTGGRIGAQLSAAIAVQEPGVSVVVGGSYGVTDRIDATAAAILGGDQGAYVAGTYYFTGGRVRPTAELGVPVFFVDGVRPGAHASAGLIWLVTDTLGVSLDVGGEHYFSAPAGYDKTLFISALGVEVRR